MKKSIDFQCLLTNAAFPARVTLSQDYISVEIRDFPCEFAIHSSSQNVTMLRTLQGHDYIQAPNPRTNGEGVNSYTIKTPSLLLEYSKSQSLLKLNFSQKEMLLNGKHQFHDLSTTIEKKINSMIFHRNIISNKLESAIKELEQHFQIRIESLLHESSAVMLKTKNFGEIRIKTCVKSDGILAMSSNLLTSRLFEYYFEMKRPLDLIEVYESLARSAEFQLVLDEALKIYSEQALKPYVPGSYTMAGLVCTANAYNEVHVCYMKEMIIGIRVSSFPYTLEIIDLAFFNSNLKKIRRFDNCLHHAMTKALKDPEMTGFRNTVVNSAPGDTFQILELHKYEHLKNSLVFIINYIHLNYLFEQCKIHIEENFKILKNSIPKPLCTWKMLDLRVELGNYDEYRYTPVLKMKNNLSGLEVDFDLEVFVRQENETEKLTTWKRLLIRYFQSAVKEICRGNLDVMYGFVKLFLIKIVDFHLIIDVIEEELNNQRVEIIWPSIVVKEDIYSFSTRIWDMHGKYVDVIFRMKEFRERKEIITNLDPNFFSTLDKNCSLVEIIRACLSKRSDEIRLRIITDSN